MVVSSLGMILDPTGEGLNGTLAFSGNPPPICGSKARVLSWLGAHVALDVEDAVRVSNEPPSDELVEALETSVPFPQLQGGDLGSRSLTNSP